MRIAVADTETTGLDEEDQVVELATVTMEMMRYEVGSRSWEVAEPVALWSTLIQPTIAVKPEARAQHHLTDKQLAAAPTMRSLLGDRGLPEFSGDVVLAAHNLEFDERLLAQSIAAAGYDAADCLPVRRICTLQCSKHVWPAAPRHGNQFLRYWLNLVVPPLSGPPHRAGPDAVVTASLLQRMLETHSVEELLTLTNTRALLQICQIGQWRGRAWADVDAGMLRWILGKKFGPDEMHTARFWLDVRAGRVPHPEATT